MRTILLFSLAFLVIGMLMPNFVRADGAPGASLAFTSKDPTVTKAVELLAEGKLKEAEDLLNQASDGEADATKGRDEAKEIIRRTRIEYSQDPDQLLAKIKKSIPDITGADLDRWTKEGQTNSRLIDGKVKYFNREPSNIFLFCKEAKDRRKAAGNAPPEDNRWKLNDHLKQVIDAAKNSDSPEVMPVKHTITYTLTIPANTAGVKQGSTVKVWLPMAQEYRQQKDVKLVSTTPKSTTVAPSATDTYPVSGAPQRTVYFEQKCEDPGKPMVFKEVIEYTSYAYYPKLEESKVQPLPADWDGRYLSERPPHIVFTPEIRQQVQEIVGSETNPLVKARKIFSWVSDNIPWHAEEEYTVIPSFAKKCFAMRKGDCGVQSTMFTTMCRIAGIPARWQSGWESKPLGWNMHDWSEIYIAPWGWLPVDASYGKQESDDPAVRDFYLGHQDSYRMIVNLDYGRELIPPKQSMRSEPADFQRGEVEVDGKNLYFNQWKYKMEFTRDPGPNFE
ncbi:MAG TPA: transglutaminase domain-containing protein [Tepidisphaeraceae bacterium]|jgi:transglutaminase-like putative cysteine protease